jgi:peptidoglycan/xylan/chitin deacetylase (PgdA/CDA1 family)
MKMRYRLKFLYIFLFFLLCACQTINRSNAECKIPQSFVTFSFDDGPNTQAMTTARLLDVLKKYDIQAYFCLLGVNAEHNPELTRRIHDEGHIIVNHGYSDKWAYNMNDNEFLNNLVMGEQAISAALGFDLQFKLYRPHGGFYKRKQERIWQETGYSLFPDTIRIYDAVITEKGQKKAVEQVINKTLKKGGGLILLHDARDSYSRAEAELAKNPEGAFNRFWIPGAVEEIIIELINKGFLIRMIPKPF